MKELPKSEKISSYIIQSQEDELKRIAIELHEGVGQTLYSVYTGLQFVETNVRSNSDVKDYVHEMSELLEKTIQEIRFLSLEIHPPTLATLGLTSALKSYIKLFTSTYGILVEMAEKGEEKNLAESKRVTLFRVCQEALGNIAKYADTLQVTINVNWERDMLVITIKDFGNGFNLEEELNYSSGLAAMVERMHLIGGECEISSVIKEGTKVNLVLPL